MAEFTVQKYKTILNKRKSPDSWFWDRYSINPYNGCQFGCIYCDARSAHYHMPEDFEQKILVKEGIGCQLARQLGNARSLVQDVVALSGGTDPYQPAEHQFRNTRQCLEVLERFRMPVHLITKSKLVLEDADLLNRVAAASWASVSITLSTVNREMARFLDFQAPDPEIRLRTLKELKARAPQLQAGILMIPIVPFLGDSPEQLEATVAAAKAAGADYLLFGPGMTLRDTQAKWFLQQLKAKYPELIPKYEELYFFRYNEKEYSGSFAPPLSYTAPLNAILVEICRRHQMPMRIPRFIPKDYRQLNYQISEKLFNQAWLSQIQGKEWKNAFFAAQAIQELPVSLTRLKEESKVNSIKNLRGIALEQVIEWLGNP
ncbi:MAG: hypothetical protein H6581_24465 [Bacteroidia bacterium]|nr:hypothetical protein [Bacteroidia bacterium]